MNAEDENNTLHPWIEPELEARLTALVLGEASDFERDELERLVADRPELGLYRKRLETMHRMLREVTSGESAEEQGEWRLGAERRAAVLARLGKSPTQCLNVVPVKKRRAITFIPWSPIPEIAATLVVVGLALCFVIPVSNKSPESLARRSELVSAEIVSSEFPRSERLEAPYTRSGSPLPHPHSSTALADHPQPTPHDQISVGYANDYLFRGSNASAGPAANADRETRELALADQAIRPPVSRVTTQPIPAEPVVVDNGGQVGALNGTAAIRAGGDLLFSTDPNSPVKLFVDGSATAGQVRVGGGFDGRNAGIRRPAQEQVTSTLGGENSDIGATAITHGGVLAITDPEPASATASEAQINAEPKTSPAYVAEEGDFLKSSVGTNVVRDTRDNVFVPLEQKSEALAIAPAAGEPLSFIGDLKVSGSTKAKANATTDSLSLTSGGTVSGAGGKERSEGFGNESPAKSDALIRSTGSGAEARQDGDISRMRRLVEVEKPMEDSIQQTLVLGDVDRTKDQVIRRELPLKEAEAISSAGTVNFGAATSTIEDLSGFFEVTETSSLDPATEQRLKNMRYFADGGSESKRVETAESGFELPGLQSDKRTFRLSVRAGSERKDVEVEIGEPWAFGRTEDVDKSVQDILALTPQLNPNASTGGFAWSGPLSGGDIDGLSAVVPRIVGGGSATGQRLSERGESDPATAQIPTLDDLVMRESVQKPEKIRAATFYDTGEVTSGPAAPPSQSGFLLPDSIPLTYDPDADIKVRYRFTLGEPFSPPGDESVPNAPPVDDEGGRDTQENGDWGIGLRLFTLGSTHVRADYASPIEGFQPDEKDRFQFTMGATFGDEVLPPSDPPAQASSLAAIVPSMETPLRRQPTPAALAETSPEAEPFSTFSLHVSDVSFQLAKAALASGQWPEVEKIRIEEFVNAFDYGDPMPAMEERVAARIDQAAHPFLQQRNLVRIALRTAEAGRSAATPLRLTLLLDSSGSMERPDRRETVRLAVATLAGLLGENDRITLVSFARQPRLVADAVPGNEAMKLAKTAAALPSEGGTNLEAALQLAFEKAREHREVNAQNRIVLLTDGAANLGDAKAESLASLVEGMREAGIAFDAAGFGAEGLNDEILEALTRKGDGRYYLLDRPEDAEDAFAKQIAGALRPAAKNVKVQVEFNPDRVKSYKLLGFEKHRLATEDFRNDAVDAAELAAAEAGVAVYQVEPDPAGQGDLGSVSVRFRDLDSDEMVERRWSLPHLAAAPSADRSGDSILLATVASQFAAKLAGGPLGDVVDLGELARLAAALPDGPRVAELRTMIEQARGIEGAR